MSEECMRRLGAATWPEQYAFTKKTLICTFPDSTFLQFQAMQIVHRQNEKGVKVMELRAHAVAAKRFWNYPRFLGRFQELRHPARIPFMLRRAILTSYKFHGESIIHE